AGACEVGAPEGGAPEGGAPEVGAREVGACEVGVPEGGACEGGVCEVGACEVGVPGGGAWEVGVCEVGACEVGAPEVGAHIRRLLCGLANCRRRRARVDDLTRPRFDFDHESFIRLSISARSRVSGAAATARAMMSATSKSMAGVATRLLALRFLSTQRTTRTWFTLIEIGRASCRERV